jgi:hypothetical protein
MNQINVTNKLLAHQRASLGDRLRRGILAENDSIEEIAVSKSRRCGPYR